MKRQGIEFPTSGKGGPSIVTENKSTTENFYKREVIDETG